MTTLAPARNFERVTPIVTLLLVFLCGAVAGAMVMSITGHRGLHGTVVTSNPPSGGLTMSVSEWKSQLDLTDEQARELTSILDDFSHYYDNLLADGKTRILQILNDSQRKKYERMMQDHKSR